MDHHHNNMNMNSSWRPPMAGNICPVCSISHFPFCPPNPNPSFYYSPPPPPPPNNYFNPPPPPNSQFPVNNNTPNTFDSYNHSYNDYNNGYDNGIKRMKVDNNERILKLIHDHGNVGAAGNRYGQETGLKRRRDDDDRLGLVYPYDPSRFDHRDSYPILGQSQFVDHHLQMHHAYSSSSSSHVPSTDVNNVFNSHVPYNNNSNNYWSESKPHYEPSRPPLPASPPPPPPPPRNHFFEPQPEKPSSANQSSGQVYYNNDNASTLSSTEDFYTPQSSSERHVRDAQQFPLQHLPLEKPTIVEASHIFKHPHRASRPDHLVIILRGLPGSGKSYLAKVLRDVEIENGGEAPRIHSMDEYFMTEVEKVEDSELSKSSGSLRGKRQVMKKVMEYCYEPEMEEAYRASMLKAFKKTLDEGVFSFIIVDDRNLRVADFAQFWATAKRSGYEVYIVEAAYKDPAGCAARNVHHFTLDDIRKMAREWEEAPSLYMKMDIKSLLHGDSVDESRIQEVDMDMEEEDAIGNSQGTDLKSPQDEIKNQVVYLTPHDASPVTDLKHHVTNRQKEVNHLSKSKWSNDLDGSESIEAEDGKKKASALSGLVNAYSKEGKSVQWGDQGGNAGFSIGTTRKTSSLVIGPGSGYNLKSNPLSEEDYLKPAKSAVEPKRQNVFQEQIRAERESFKAVFDKRRHRIGGFNIDEE